MGDDVDVEVGSRLTGDGGAHAGAEGVLPRPAAADAEHDLGCVHTTREVEQGGRDVIAYDVVERAAEVLDQGPLGRELLGRGGTQAVAAGDVDREHLTAGCPSRRAGRHGG